MEKKYTYENGIIYVLIPNKESRTIRRATEKFLRKVIVENKGANSKWEQ